MPYIESSIIINKSPYQIYQLAKKLEDFPLYMPEVKKIKIIEASDNYTITEWQTEIEGSFIIWKEQEWYDDEKLTITYRLLEGDLDKFEGCWQFIEHPQGGKVILTVDFDFGVPALEELMGPVLTLKVKENSRSMLEALKQKLEA